MAVGNLHPVAANEESFWPAECKDAGFISWSHRVVLRITNLSAGSSFENRTRQILVAEGIPCPAWISALMFMMEMVRSKQRGAKNGGAA